MKNGECKMRKLNRKQDKAIKIITEWMLDYYLGNQLVIFYRDTINMIRIPEDIESNSVVDCIRQFKKILNENIDSTNCKESNFILNNFNEIFNFRVPGFTIIKDSEYIDELIKKSAEDLYT